MGLARRALGLEKRAFGDDTARIPGPTESWRSFAGPMVNEDTSLAHIDVYKCVSLIADAISVIPFRAHRNIGWVDNYGNRRMYGSKVPRQPILLTDPMPGDLASEFNFKHRVMSSLLLSGDSFNEVNARDEQGYPSVVTPIHPSKVRKVDIDDRGRLVYEMHDGGVLGHIRDGGTMIHWPGFVRAGEHRGISPIRAGMQGIALSMAAEEFGSRWFGDGAHPSGYLSNAGEVSKEDALATKRAWVQTFGGLSREPAYLYGGLEWHPVQINPEESQFIETRRLQTSQIASLYRVPPHLVGDVDKTTSWGTGIEEQGLGFVVYTLGPWIARFEQVMTALVPRGQYVKGNFGALLRGRQQDRYQSYATGIQWGWLSTNDVRELEDLPPLPHGDTYLQPLNMIDASTALDQQQGNTDDAEA